MTPAPRDHDAVRDARPTIALYHHLPPGGADRAMYELTRRTNDAFRYVHFEIARDCRDLGIGRPAREGPV